MAISISGNGRTAYGPRITRDGLILYYDAANTKSFKGEPTTNLVADPKPTGLWTVGNYLTSAATITYESEDGIPHLKISDIVYDSGYPRIQYTYLTGTISSNFSASFEAKGTEGSQITLNIYSSFSTKITLTATLTADWQRFEFNNVSNGGFVLDYPYLRPLTTGSTQYLRKIQIESKTYSTTFVDGTRGTTVTTGGGWADLTTNTYHGVLVNGTREDTAGRGSLLFDGVDDYIAIESPSNRWDWTPSSTGLNTMTIDFWIKTSDSSGYAVSKPWNGNGEYNYTIASGIYWSHSIGNQSNSLQFTSYATGNWENVTCIVTPTQKAVYRNGILDAGFTNHGITNNIPTYANASLPLSLMTLYPYGVTFNQPSFSVSGNISLVRIYNRILTATEIADNYRANRSRFST